MRQEINAVLYKFLSRQNVHKALDVTAMFRTLVYFYRLRDDPYLVRVYSRCTYMYCTYVCMYVCALVLYATSSVCGLFVCVCVCVCVCA